MPCPTALHCRSLPCLHTARTRCVTIINLLSLSLLFLEGSQFLGTSPSSPLPRTMTRFHSFHLFKRGIRSKTIADLRESPSSSSRRFLAPCGCTASARLRKQPKKNSAHDGRINGSGSTNGECVADVHGHEGEST